MTFGFELNFEGELELWTARTKNGATEFYGKLARDLPTDPSSGFLCIVGCVTRVNGECGAHATKAGKANRRSSNLVCI